MERYEAFIDARRKPGGLYSSLNMTAFRFGRTTYLTLRSSPQGCVSKGGNEYRACCHPSRR
jgi:hypothetical protein